jgi:hypothetical protein
VSAARLRELVWYLLATAVFLLVSRVLFDLLAGRPMFWSSHEQVMGFLWTCLVGGPFILFALLVAAQSKPSGK